MKDADIAKLKKLIGVAATDKVDAVEENYNNDMEKYGGGFPEDVRFYRPLLEKMQKTIDDENDELADAKAKIPMLKAEYDELEANRDLQLEEIPN